MAQIEIDSPLTGSQVPPGFTVTGWTDQLNCQVTVTVTNGTNTQVLTTTSDPTTGNWSVTTNPTLIPPGTGYSITAVVTLPGGGATSDYTDDISVAVGAGNKPLAIHVTSISSQQAKNSKKVPKDIIPLAISGEYAKTLTQATTIVVQALVFRTTKIYSAYSIGTIDVGSLETEGQWSISLTAPKATPSKPNRIVIRALIMDDNHVVLGQNTLKKTS
jgi:hypothetical protein